MRGANSLRQFGEEGGESVGGELRAVKSGLWQAAEGVGDLRSGDKACFVDGFAGEKLSERGGAGERGDTALSFEAYGGDFAVVEAGSESKNVAADGILYIDHGRRVGQIAGVARIFEMVEDGGGIHERKVYRRRRIGESGDRRRAR